MDTHQDEPSANTYTAQETDLISGNEAPSIEPRKPQNSRKKIVVLTIIAIVIVMLTAGLIALGVKRFSKKDAVNTMPVFETNEHTEIQPEPQPFKAVRQEDGSVLVNGERTWLKSPVKLNLANYLLLDDPYLANEAQTTKEPSAEVYKIGFTKNGEDILRFVRIEPGAPSLMFIGRQGVDLSGFKLVKRHSPDAYYEGKLNYTLAAGVTEDISTVFSELILPEFIELKGKRFTLNSRSLHRTTELVTTVVNGNEDKYTVFGSTDYGDVYHQQKDSFEKSINPQLYKSERYILSDFAWGVGYYLPTPDLRELKAEQISFDDNSKNNDSYGYGFHGCALGGSYNDVFRDPSANFTQVGKTTTGLLLFTPNLNPKIQKYYDIMLENYNTSYERKLTMTEFLASRPLLVYKNDLGENAIIYNLAYLPAAGCGKPVVYLYPPVPTQVSVSIDADIRISVPEYKSGWRVTAYPSGTLVNSDGVLYRNLFWEGYSKYYPDVQEGTIVSQSEVQSTLKKHLGLLGLNEQESKDFLEYWLPKMPANPYVRLTWFGTNQVNQMAPIHVEPRPDTLIRIFLDYEGLDQPAHIQPQRLKSIPRKGFTVVEWGGLLKEPLL